MTTWVLAEDLGIEDAGRRFHSHVENRALRFLATIKKYSPSLRTINPPSAFDWRRDRTPPLPPTARWVRSTSPAFLHRRAACLKSKSPSGSTLKAPSPSLLTTRRRVPQIICTSPPIQSTASKLREATASPRLQNPINLRGANGEMSVLIPAGDYLPSSTRLTVRTRRGQSGTHVYPPL